MASNKAPAPTSAAVPAPTSAVDLAKVPYLIDPATRSNKNVVSTTNLRKYLDSLEGHRSPTRQFSYRGFKKHCDTEHAEESIDHFFFIVNKRMTAWLTLAAKVKKIS